MEHIAEIIEQYGIYAVLVLCTFEGDITLLISGVMAHSGAFGQYSFLKVFAVGVTGGVVGDCCGYFVGRLFRETVKNCRFYKMAQPRIERLIDKFGGYSIIISKYIYGIRVGMVVFNGMGNMPFARFLLMDIISCSLWVLILTGAGYFFSGAITSLLGDFERLSYYAIAIVAVGIIGFYLLERFWLSKKVEEADPEAIHKFEEKIHQVEEAAQEKLHDIGERLHLTNAPNSREEKPPVQIKKEIVKSEKD
jgi:membrane protein DedA with SNARE-associated domain